MSVVYGAGEVDSGLPAFLEDLVRRPPRIIPIPATAASKEILGRPCLLVGFSFRESSGSAVATAEIVNGRSGNAGQAAEISLAAAGFDTESFPAPGLYCDQGVWLAVIVGSVVGAIWARY